MKNVIYEGCDSISLKEAAYKRVAELLNHEEISDSNIKTFVDLMVITPENGVIGVGAARLISEFASLSPVNAKNRVVCILNMQASTINFQNAILKVLEESSACFVITTTMKLLDTVYSRAEKIVLGRVINSTRSGRKTKDYSPILKDIIGLMNQNSPRAVMDAFGILNAKKKSIFETKDSREVIEIIQEVKEWFYDKGLHSNSVHGVHAAYNAIRVCDNGLQMLEKKSMTKTTFEAMIEELFSDYWIEFIDVSKAS